MGWIDLLGRIFRDDGTQLEVVTYDLEVEAYYKRLAIESSINLIANTLVRSKFVTYEKGVPVRKNMHYLFNVQPNKNQNATEFFHRLVSNLIYENEALVIMQDDQLVIADDWDIKEFALKPNIYSNIAIKDFTFEKTFSESEVFHYKLNNKKMMSIIDGLYDSYGKILAAGMQGYKRSHAKRAVAEIDSTGPLTEQAQKDREDLFNNQYKRYLLAEGGAVLPIPKGIKHNEEKNVAPQTSRDVRAIIDDVFDMVATALHIPKGLLKGDLADVSSQVDIFLMLCANPIAELIEDENNRKAYTKQEYLERTYMRVDTTMVKHVDITSIATALDKLLSSGMTNIDEGRELANWEPLNEWWSTKHFITKNYQEVEDYLINGPNQAQPLKGGESE